MNKELQIGVLVSGRGSNLQSIIDAIEEDRLPAVIKVVVSDVREAFALERCARHGLRGIFLDPAACEGKEAYDRGLIALLREHGVELVAMAGFMRILTPVFIEAFRNRVMNIHPSLLPSFPGLHVQQKALDYGARFSGCTVHFADEGVDAGPIIVQAVVPVLDDDNDESLSERILRQEHRIYPEAIRLYAEGRLKVRGRRVLVRGAAGEQQRHVLINPPLRS